MLETFKKIETDLTKRYRKSVARSRTFTDATPAIVRRLELANMVSLDRQRSEVRQLIDHNSKLAAA